jgi:hypothetical protein
MIAVTAPVAPEALTVPALITPAVEPETVPMSTARAFVNVIDVAFGVFNVIQLFEPEFVSTAVAVPVATLPYEEAASVPTFTEVAVELSNVKRAPPVVPTLLTFNVIAPLFAFNVPLFEIVTV